MASEQVIVSAYNCLGENRYYDLESKQSWAFDHITQVRSIVPKHSKAKSKR